ncbi:MAG: glycolate oxidase subunit GlcD [Pyrinomonas sp.]
MNAQAQSRRDGTRERVLRSETLDRLAQIVGPESVLTEEGEIAVYGKDALGETHLPDAVVRPRTAQEVAAIVHLANELLIPLTVRGGGVGYTGGAVPIRGGIVLSTERMNSIKEINFDDLYAVVEPGVRTYELQQAVEAQGLFYPPDPSSLRDSFIGGNIAENAGGPRSVKYGVTKHYVLGLEVVTPTGDIIRAGGRTTKNVVGFDLVGLMCGSEGLLGIITEATLRLLPLPEATQTVRALFRSMHEACACVPQFVRARIVPTAIEVMDRHAIRAVEEAFSFGIPRQAEALLLVSVDGSRAEVEREAQIVEQILIAGGGFDVQRAKDKADEDRLWEVRRALSPAIMRYGTLKLNNDVVVPRSRIPELIARVEEIARRQRIFVVNFGHAGDGNIHVNFMCDREDTDAVRRAREAVRATFAAAIELGGTISAEHGIGYTKAPYLDMALSAETIETMMRLKKALDPNLILNPGKVFVARQQTQEGP